MFLSDFQGWLKDQWIKGSSKYFNFVFHTACPWKESFSRLSADLFPKIVFQTKYMRLVRNVLVSCIYYPGKPIFWTGREGGGAVKKVGQPKKWRGKNLGPDITFYLILEKKFRLWRAISPNLCVTHATLPPTDYIRTQY